MRRAAAVPFAIVAMLAWCDMQPLHGRAAPPPPPTCVVVLCADDHPRPTDTPPDASATPVTLPAPSASLPPTATPLPAHTPVPTPEVPLPSGAAPQAPNAEITPASIAVTSSVALGAAPVAGGDSFGAILAIVFAVLLVIASGSAWLFRRLG